MLNARTDQPTGDEENKNKANASMTDAVLLSDKETGLDSGVVTPPILTQRSISGKMKMFGVDVHYCGIELVGDLKAYFDYYFPNKD